ncbi:HNH endonuclease [Paenarthrobacter nicotinovorans]|jgi:hypothetical protein|uniref:HNH endonuclease n=1 Tax=Paenarthrobacter nicotinovorans TaxID=29320 RepID=UPI0037481E31
MTESRPAVPLPLQRRLKEEAGYRCAIPGCGQTVALELAHIEPWSKVKEHRFENMICLCSTCHTRFDIVKDIPKLSILQFKRNLSLLSHRYTQVENQLLSFFAKIATAGYNPFDYKYAIHPGMNILFSNLYADGLFTDVADQGHATIRIQGVEPNRFITPTKTGADFIRRMVDAGDLEG